MYQLVRFDQYDYTELSKIKVSKYRGKGRTGYYNNAIIMLDTETSKSGPVMHDINGDIIPQPNYVVAFTLSIRFKGKNICTLYGNRPSELMECINHLRTTMAGTLFIYIFNLPYDYFFLRKFLFKSFGYPKKQLCIKAHKPILFEFHNDIILKDAYVLSGRKLEKWAEDLNVEHKKSCGKWDYSRIRQQSDTSFTPDELEYIEHDTLAGVECLEATMLNLNKNISSIPYTVTGIVRDRVKAEGEKQKAHTDFLRCVPGLTTQQKLEKVFHGGYTHGNRYYYGEILNNVTCFDFTSSYPFIMLAFKLPCSKFSELEGSYSINEILSDSTDYAFIFKFCAYGVNLKDYLTPMPYLQFSKCTVCINPVLDNGRIIACDYCEIYLTEYDLMILNDLYNFERHACVEVEYSLKRYLPRWYTDIVYNLFKDKCTKKGGDPAEYALIKGMLNSLYGNTVQRPCRVTIEEDFETGEYIEKDFDIESEYNKYINKRKNVILYQWGVFVTAIAAWNLYRLGKCVDYEHGGIWAYSDTDSCYSNLWDMQKIDEYNQDCIRRLKANNYDTVLHNGKEYNLGVATFDGSYSEYIYLGAKRYCGRDAESGKLKITVAGVPKKNGALCLNDDINNFKQGFCFPGSITGKLTHSYIYAEDIYKDKNGNEVADSIDLNECSYILDQEQLFDFNEYVEVDEYEASNFR